jgi:hypothetical protein
MRSGQIKLGRNDFCHCGSGVKYKKCCLPTDGNSIAESQEQITRQIKDSIGDKCTVISGELEIKMSAIILHLAEDLLKLAKTKVEHQKAISVTCFAWNFAVMFDEREREDKLEEFIDSQITNSQDRHDLSVIVHSIIEKRDYYYPEVNRIIVHYELLGNKGDFRLNVASTVAKEDIPQLA